LEETIMTGTIQEFEKQALKFPAHDRAMLAERLIASLDELSVTENEQLWVEEAEARYEAYKRGELTARPAEDVLRDARAAR
jgi:putative addiction module component (TIGR02574 family)